MNQISPEIAWPPLYKIKKHRRAKHVKMRTSQLHGLEITVPYRFNLKYIPDILEENKAWITQQLYQWQAKQQAVLPEKLMLTAIEKCWTIHVVSSDSKSRLIERPNQEIVLLGDVTDVKACKKRLLSWVKAQAKIHLVAQLESVSKAIQLSFSSVSIRDQRTLWGSCTINKSINLNYKLIFLPPLLAKHVMIHELCHTVHLNHSEKFWGLVSLHDPLWKEHKQILRRADQFIPAWVQ